MQTIAKLQQNCSNVTMLSKEWLLNEAASMKPETALKKVPKMVPLTAPMACLAVHPENQGVALWRAWIACQSVLQSGNEFIAVQRDHAVVMVRCDGQIPLSVCRTLLQ